MLELEYLECVGQPLPRRLLLALIACRIVERLGEKGWLDLDGRMLVHDKGHAILDELEMKGFTYTRNEILDAVERSFGMVDRDDFDTLWWMLDNHGGLCP